MYVLSSVLCQPMHTYQQKDAFPYVPILTITISEITYVNYVQQYVHHALCTICVQIVLQIIIWRMENVYFLVQVDTTLINLL